MNISLPARRKRESQKEYERRVIEFITPKKRKRNNQYKSRSIKNNYSYGFYIAAAVDFVLSFFILLILYEYNYEPSGVSVALLISFINLILGYLTSKK